MPQPPVLSQRARQMPASPIRRLAPFADAAERAGRRVLRLNIGQPDIATPRELLDRLRTFERSNLAYGPSGGLPEFVEVLRTYHRKWDLELGQEEIFVTTGGSEALLFVLAAVADPGDEVLVFEPFYTNYSGFAELVGVATVPVATRAEDGYHLPERRAIEVALGPRTRAILLCSPNNPTGTVYADHELETVAALCRERGLFLVSDEVYREFTYDGRRHRSALTLDGLEQQVIVVDSLSKRASMCGARIGWIASRNRGLMDCVLKFGQARLCPPTLGQWLALAWNDVPEAYLRAVVAEFQRRRDVVHAALSRTPGVTVRRPEGAFYVCPRIPVADAQRFAEFLLRDFDVDGETVMVAPADGFYATPGLGRDEIRLAYVLEERALSRAMRILAAGLEAFPGRV
jgi:aspartate aminotransferase